MENRRRSWHRALMEGTKTLTFSSGFILLFVFIYNTINGIDAYEYYYLFGPIFIISLLISYRDIYQNIKQLKQSLLKKISNVNK